MNKTYCILILLLISVFTIYADITENDIKFKKNPELGIENAVILLKKGVIEHTYGSSTSKNTIYVKMKLFTKKAIEDYGTLKLTINPQKESIKNIKCTVYLPNNNKVKLSKKDIHTKKLSKEWGNKEKEISIVFPSLVEGAIIEYSYSHIYNYLNSITKWYFQSDLHTVQSEIKYVPWPAFRTGLSMQNQIAPPQFSDVTFNRHRCFELKRSNISRLKKEKFSLAYDSLKEAVIFYYSDSTKSYDNYWIDRGNDIFKTYYKKKMKSCKASKKIVLKHNLKDSNPDIMIQKIYTYVLENYIPILKASKKENEKINKKYLKKLLRAETVKQMLKLKYLSKDKITFILASLIKSASPEIEISLGLYVPWNVSIFSKNVKTFQQFTDIALKASYKGKSYWLSPSKRLLPANVIPWGLRGNKIMLIGENGTRFEKIPLEKFTENTSETKVDVSIINDRVVIRSTKTYDKHEAYRKRSKLTFFEDKEIYDLLDKNIRDIYGEKAKLFTYNIQNLKDISKKLIISQQFSFPSELDEVGDKIFMKLIGLNKYKKNHFNSQKREHIIVFKYPKIETQFVTYHLPKHLKLASLPENFNINSNGLAYSMVYSQNKNNVINLKVEDKLERSLYRKEAVSYLKSIYDNIIKANYTTLILEERE